MVSSPIAQLETLFHENMVVMTFQSYDSAFGCIDSIFNIGYVSIRKFELLQPTTNKSNITSNQSIHGIWHVHFSPIRYNLQLLVGTTHCQIFPILYVVLILLSLEGNNMNKVLSNTFFSICITSNICLINKLLQYDNSQNMLCLCKLWFSSNPSSFSLFLRKRPYWFGGRQSTWV